jgi:hypothetical protein
MWVWVAMVVLFFSMPRSKLLGYVLPALPPLAFLIADGFLTLATPSMRAKRLWWSGSAIGAVLSVVAVALFTVHPRHSSRELAAALATQRGPGEPVFMLNHFYYDVPFYARMHEPVNVVDDWSSPDMNRSDNWRKELADGGHFAPKRAASRLITPASLPAALCASPVSWVIGPDTAGATYAFLAQARTIVNVGDTSLWKVETVSAARSNVLPCAGLDRDNSSGQASKATEHLSASSDSGPRPR